MVDAQYTWSRRTKYQDFDRLSLIFLKLEIRSCYRQHQYL